MENLRVWHIPQVPGNPFHVKVKSPEQAIDIMNILADYDLCQLENKIKPDYSSLQGLEIFEDGEWIEWYSDDGDEIQEYAETLQELS